MNIDVFNTLTNFAKSKQKRMLVGNLIFLENVKVKSILFHENKYNLILNFDVLKSELYKSDHF